MKKILLALVVLFTVSGVSAQDKKKKDRSSVISRAGDHIMLQLSSDHWMGTPDSIDSHMGGFSRGLNAYVMLDKVFKSAPQFSVAFGLGVSSSNMFFKKMGIDVKSKNASIPFTSLDSADHFKKYKLSTTYLEVPIEFRFSNTPEKDMKSIKAAIGVKVGTMLNAHTKGKNLQDKNGSALNSYTEKETSKRFFNSTRIAATARVGYGNFSIFGSYQLGSLFKDGAGPDVRLLQVGLTLSGL